MSSIAYVNGEFLPLSEAKISVLDRGFLLADGVYEVTAMLDGGLVDNAHHVARLKRSLGEVRIAMPVGEDELARLQLELARRNGMREGLLYLQVTRGAGENRDFRFPPSDVPPSLVMFATQKALVETREAETGVSILTVPDIRWKRRDIKSVALLAQVLAKQEAAEAGCFEAWMVEDGFVTEGGFSSAFIITRQDQLIVRPLNNTILPGVTRISMLELARQRGLAMEERAFSVEEAYEAAEAFITSASSFVTAVVTIDGRTIGDGLPGPHTRALRQLYIENARGSLVMAA